MAGTLGSATVISGRSARDVCLDGLLGGSKGPHAPATVWLALYTVAPSASGGGTEVPGGLGYVRVSLANTLAVWADSSGGVKYNAGLITFGTATANWGSIVAAALHSAASGDALYMYGLFSPPQSVATGVTPQYPAGTLGFTAT